MQTMTPTLVKLARSKVLARLPYRTASVVGTEQVPRVQLAGYLERDEDINAVVRQLVSSWDAKLRITGDNHCVYVVAMRGVNEYGQEDDYRPVIVYVQYSDHAIYAGGAIVTADVWF